MLKNKNGFKEFVKLSWGRAITFILLVILLSLIPVLILGISPFWYAVESNAMAPAYVKGDIIFVKSTNYDITNIGDVIVHKAGDNLLFIMRVISKNEAERIFTTKGDNNPGSLLPQIDLPENKIVAKVIGKIPILGWLDLWKIGFLIRIVAVYFLACLIIYLIKKKR